MGSKTTIEWCDFTFNPWWGCTRKSPGCENCYAETFSHRLGLKIWGPQEPRRFFGDKHWDEPLAWNRAAERDRVRRRVFCASMADVMEDRPELVEHRWRLARLIKQTYWLDWLLLTKRPENALRLWKDVGGEWGVNVWIGTTAEDQKRADERIPHLLEIPAMVRFLSCEPLLEDIDVTDGFDNGYESNGPGGWIEGLNVDWVIVGGESGPHARNFNPAWAKSIVKQCRGFRVPVHVKQFGSNVLEFSGTFKSKKDPKGADWTRWPEELRIREYPSVHTE